MDTTMRDRAEADLKKIQAEKHRIETRLVALAEEARELETFLGVWMRLSPRETQSDMLRPSGPLADPTIEIKEAAVYAFQQAPKAMRSRELAERLIDMGFPYDKGIEALDASLRGILSRNTEEQEGPFTKFDRGLYGLASWTRAQRVLAGGEEVPSMDAYEKTPEPAATDPGDNFEREG